VAPARGGRLVRLANLRRLPLKHLHPELEVPDLIHNPLRRAAANDDGFRVVGQAHHDQRVPGAQRRSLVRVLDLRGGEAWEVSVRALWALAPAAAAKALQQSIAAHACPGGYGSPAQATLTSIVSHSRLPTSTGMAGPLPQSPPLLHRACAPQCTTPGGQPREHTARAPALRPSMGSDRWFPVIAGIPNPVIPFQSGNTPVNVTLYIHLYVDMSNNGKLPDWLCRATSPKTLKFVVGGATAGIGRIPGSAQRLLYITLQWRCDWVDGKSMLAVADAAGSQRAVSNVSSLPMRDAGWMDAPQSENCAMILLVSGIIARGNAQ
jgi:hypothetical protein